MLSNLHLSYLSLCVTAFTLEPVPHTEAIVEFYRAYTKGSTLRSMAGILRSFDCWQQPKLNVGAVNTRGGHDMRHLLLSRSFTEQVPKEHFTATLFLSKGAPFIYLRPKQLPR